MELLNNLGINGKLLLAQIVNFLILLFVLHRYAYKPVLKILNDRTEKIEKGLGDAEEAKKKLLEITEKEKVVLGEARKEAQTIIDSAEKTALKNKEDLLDEAKKKSEEIVSNTQKQLEEEKKKMLSEIKSEIAELVVLATDKVIGEKLNSEKDKKLIEEAIK